MWDAPRAVVSGDRSQGVLLGREGGPGEQKPSPQPHSSHPGAVSPPGSEAPPEAPWLEARVPDCGAPGVAGPPCSAPGHVSACGSGLAAVSGRSAVQVESLSAPRHVLRSLRHVPEPGGLGAPAPGLQQHHPDVQRQHPADQPSHRSDKELDEPTRN